MAIKIAFTDVHIQCCANYHSITIAKIIQTGIQVKQLVKKYPCRTKFRTSSLKVHTFKIVLFILFVYVKIHFYFQNSGFCN